MTALIILPSSFEVTILGWDQSSFRNKTALFCAIKVIEEFLQLNLNGEKMVEIRNTLELWLRLWIWVEVRVEWMNESRTMGVYNGGDGSQ